MSTGISNTCCISTGAMKVEKSSSMVARGLDYHIVNISLVAKIQNKIIPCPLENICRTDLREFLGTFHISSQANFFSKFCCMLDFLLFAFYFQSICPFFCNWPVYRPAKLR